MGAQEARTRIVDNIKLASMVDLYVEFRGEMYLKLSRGNLLPKRWEDLHHWFGSAIAPKEWIDSLATTAPSSFSNVDRAKEDLIQFKFDVIDIYLFETSLDRRY